MADRYTVGSLFAGIGGIDLGLERTGYFRTAWVCERDPYCQRVLAKHWPDVPVYDDVADIGEDTPAVDVIAAGFPCQPVSHAGRRKARDDERWLWPHVERCISVLRPRGVLLENVPGLFTAGFGDVIGGLAACGYAAEWDCIPAAAVGAPHRRDRVFIVAARPDVANVSTNEPWDCPMEDTGSARPQGAIGSVMAGTGGRGLYPDAAGPSGARNQQAMADAAGAGHTGPWEHRKRCDPQAHGAGEAGVPVASSFGQKWAAEPDVGRVANGVPGRVDRLRALGNAVVPQVAEYVGHQLARVMGVANA